jgi:UDP-N-acetylmuramyl pentapeptide phosphotransferase/UDP-N-acetylglucosamine-1-phosphate transferase
LIIQIIIAFFISAVVSGALIFYFANGGKIGLDNFKNAEGGKSEPQKFHIKPTSRVGGAGIFLAFITVMLMLWFKLKVLDYIYLPLAALPIFTAGFAEDITRKISPKVRLAAGLVSALLTVYFLKAELVRTDIWFIDSLLNVQFVAVIVTVVAIIGLANSFNIIDGYNGLSSIVSTMILFSLGYISFKVGDIFLMKACFILAFAIFGFFIWNYPFGKIFLGDGGAYFIGFFIAAASLLLVDRYKAVSPWFPLLLCIYPIFETLFSIYRRKLKKTSSLNADALHLHTLIYKRLVPRIFGTDIKDNVLAHNYATSPFLWMLASLSVIPALLFWNNTFILIIFVLIFITVYIWLYKSIVDFKLWKFIKKRAKVI